MFTQGIVPASLLAGTGPLLNASALSKYHVIYHPTLQSCKCNGDNFTQDLFNRPFVEAHHTILSKIGSSAKFVQWKKWKDGDKIRKVADFETAKVQVWEFMAVWRLGKLKRIVWEKVLDDPTTLSIQIFYISQTLKLPQNLTLDHQWFQNWPTTLFPFLAAILYYHLFLWFTMSRDRVFTWNIKVTRVFTWNNSKV